MPTCYKTSLVFSFILLIISFNTFANNQPLTQELIDSLNKTGFLLVKQDPDSAEVIFSLAIDKSAAIDYTKGEIKALIGMARVQRLHNNKPAALELLQKTQQLAERANYREEIFNVTIEIGNLHQREANYKLAQQYYEQAAKIANELQLPELHADVLLSHGNNACFQNQFPEAIAYYEKALPIYEAQHDTAKMLRPLLNLGYALYGVKKYDEARIALEKGLKYALAVKDDRNISAVYISMADVSNVEKKYNQAIVEVEKALAIAEKMDNLNLKKDCYERLSKAYAEMGDYEKAYGNQSIFSELAFQLFSEHSNAIINEMETRFQTEKKEGEIVKLSQENKIKDLHLQRNRVWLLALGGLTLALIAIFFLVILFIRQKRLKEQQDKVELEQRLLRSQMNPHFIFNSLVAIQSFMLNNDSKEAGKFLSKFSRLMRMVLEHSRKEYVPLDKEIELLTYYLDLQVLRFSNSFDYSLETDGVIAPENYAIPPMLAQPFIENAIEHGLSGLDKKGHVTVNFRLDDGTILFTVEDNGAGLNGQAQVKRGGHKSFASQITKERLALLNKKRKHHIEFKLENILNDKDEVQGTRTTFSISFKSVQSE